ncbi:MAG: hypothetical protein E7551_00935 [Ruminococcaceae bacterium]|nr:hypothetical protein [Oscillospiraceae bacterium]
MKKASTVSSKNTEKLYNNFPRIFKWIFSKSGVITIAFEHFLAMLPATILVPILVNNSCGSIIDVSLVLFTSGLGTIVFSLFSMLRIDREKKKFYIDKPIPAYLGSSFAYIAITIYLLDSHMNIGIEPNMAFVYVGWAYFFSSILLIIFSTMFYFIKGLDRFLNKYLPATVIGPAISLIGLELSDTAISDAGFKTANGMDLNAILVSMITLSVIILLSVIRRKFWNNAAIILGVVTGYIVYIMVNGMPQIAIGSIFDISKLDFHLPLMTLPKNWIRLLISIIPATLVVFTESIGRVTVINRMTNGDSDAKIFDEKSIKVIGSAVLSHGFASLSSVLVGSVPNTIYAENIAVMGIYRNKKDRKDPCEFVNKITDPYSSAPYLIAAVIAMLFAFSGFLQNIILSIPKPVIGGMELFLFGIISAPGIQLLVEQRVNYKKISNQIITASVLLTGISELSIKINWFEIKGMSLGLVVGFCLNILVLFLKWMGILCDPITIDEAAKSCLSAVQKSSDKVTVYIPNCPDLKDIPENKKLISILEGFGNDARSEDWRDNISRASEISLRNTSGDDIVCINKHENSLTVSILKDVLSEQLIAAYLNDYNDATDVNKEMDDNEEVVAEYLVIDLSRNIPLRKIETLIKQIEW